MVNDLSICINLEEYFEKHAPTPEKGLLRYRLGLSYDGDTRDISFNGVNYFFKTYCPGDYYIVLARETIDKNSNPTGYAILWFRTIEDKIQWRLSYQ